MAVTVWAWVEGTRGPPTWLNDRTDPRSAMRAPLGQGWQAADKGEGHAGPRTWESTVPSPNKAANVDGGRVCRLRSGLQCGGKALLAELGDMGQAAAASSSHNQSQ